MTIDGDTSIYVGGLPYGATEESLRRAFDLFGSVVAVKVINDREVEGKCYGFVTFTNPRSAIDAISDMNGRTIGGRVVRVNEVRARGGRPNFHENFRRDAGRDIDWDRERERDRDFIRDRDQYRDRNTERSRDRYRERERDYEHGRDSDRSREHGRDLEDHNRERIRDHDRDWERDHDMDWDEDREVDKTKDHDGGRDKDKEQQSRNRPGARLNDRRSRELSSNSSDNYQDQVKEELDLFIHRREELQTELAQIQEMVEDKEQLVSDLKKKSQNLEDALADAKKLSSQRQIMLTKLHRCFLQSQDYSKRFKSCEMELQLLVDTTMASVEDANTRIGSVYANGRA